PRLAFGPAPPPPKCAVRCRPPSAAAAAAFYSPPSLSQMSEDRITEMEKSRRTAQFSLGKTEAQTGKIPPTQAAAAAARHQNRASSASAPISLPAQAWRQVSSRGCSSSSFHLNQMPRATRLTALLLTPGAAAKHRCQARLEVRDAGYHAPWTRTTTASPTAAASSTPPSSSNARDEPERPPAAPASSAQQLHYRRQPAAGAGGLSRTAEPRPPPPLPPRRPATAEAALSDATAVVTTSLSERAGPSGLCAATIGTVDPAGRCLWTHAAALIDALETLRDSDQRQHPAWRCSRAARPGGGGDRVVFLKIGEIDTLKELYHADAFIQAKWKEPLLEGRGAEELKKHRPGEVLEPPAVT
uniref:ALOG domain-containing protein n=1 Tax=Macrostomum lignano TaxID=282301 RepID=A0A1I8FN03_9PLAT